MEQPRRVLQPSVGTAVGVVASFVDTVGNGAVLSVGTAVGVVAWSVGTVDVVVASLVPSVVEQLYRLVQPLA